MEFVAIEAIEEGEEVFIDYGEEWHDAWKRHMERWEPPRGREGGTFRRAR